MKTFLSISLFSICVLAMLASAPHAAQADDWVMNLGDCISSYVQERDDAWSVWDASPQQGPDENQLDYSLGTAFDTYQACNAAANVPTISLDLCPAAYEAFTACNNAFPGWDNSQARIECRLATGFEGACQ